MTAAPTRRARWRRAAGLAAGVAIGLSTTAAATEPRPVAAEAHVVALSRPDWSAGAGVGLVGRPWARVHVEGMLDLSVGAAGFGAQVRAQVRGYLTDPTSRLGALAVVAGPGVDLADPVVPHLLLGAGLDLPPIGRVTLRAEAAAIGSLADPIGGRLAVGGLLGPQPSPPLPPTPAPPRIDPVDALVWLPHPVCAFVPPSDLPRWRDTVGDALVRFSAPGFLPSWGSADVSSLTLKAAPVQGTVAVVAWPGDRVTSGATTVPVGTDGVALLTVPPGPVPLVIEGNGRRDTPQGVVFDGYGLWLRASRPEPVEVRFDVGSSRLDPDALATLAGLAALAGDGAFVVAGSASPEGVEAANLKLAEDRARAAVDALVAAGVPAARVRVAPPLPPDPERAFEPQRFVRVTPDLGDLR